MYGREEEYLQVSVGTPEGTRLLEGPRLRHEDIIKIDVR
jgi:hypothetical protein